MKKYIFTICFIVLASVCHTPGVQAREMAVSGKFYPADKQELSDYVDSALAKASIPALNGRVAAVLAPHAGYPYSGAVAAYAFKAIEDSYDTVVVLGVGHKNALKGASILNKGSYETPLGKIETDKKLAEELIKSSPFFEADTAAHDGEHSIEVELPFLQRRLKKPFKLVAILLNTYDSSVLTEIGAKLGARIKNKKVLMVVSTDLSHYPAHNAAKIADTTLALAIRTMDPYYFWLTNRILTARGIPGLSTCACGEAAVTAAMAAVREMGPAEFITLKYADSYDENPSAASSDSVVGYLAGAFVLKAKPAIYRIDPSKEERAAMLAFARRSIERGFENMQLENQLSRSDLFLNLPAAVFVTLTENGALRGCIGTVEARMPLGDAVEYAAKSAAFLDRRFSPLTREELGKIKIEISILSPLAPIKNATEIVPHKHGVVLVQGERSGLFLPQVWEQIPEKKAFLKELCSQKAGLDDNCWQDKKTKLYIFTVNSFSE